jgi:hypothetical protein
VTTPTSLPSEPLDDDAIAAAVRDTVGHWAMPAVRLDSPGWRERVRTPRARRLDAVRGALGRVGQAAGAAVALTVVAALLGVYLSNRDAGKPNESPSRTPGTSHPTASHAAASPLPRLFTAGQLTAPTTVLVSNEGVFELLDLTTGELHGRIGSGQYQSRAWLNADGTVTCLCVAGDGYSRNGSALVTVGFMRYDRTGTSISTAVVGTYRGTPDPRDPVTASTPQDAAVQIAPGPVDGTALIGWTVHAHPVWKSGVDVVDLAAGTILQHLALPSRNDGEGTLRVSPDGPRPVGIDGNGDLLLEQTWSSWSPPQATNPDYHFGADVFSAHPSGRTLSDAMPFDAARECGSDIFIAGARPSGGTWLACESATGAQTNLRLIDPNGSVNDTTIRGGVGLGEGTASDVSPDGRWLYLWDATSLELTRVSLQDGTSKTVTGSSTAALDPLTALGRWLAPPAAAKILLAPGMAISPDGGKVYALGVDPTPINRSGFAGSTGILVFDAASMTQVGRWTPTADFVSIAVNADGSQVYALGASEVSADGSQDTQPASATVFDASTGAVRAISGNLGQGFLTFTGGPLP